MISFEQWLKTNAAKLEISINRLTEIEEIFSQIHDFETTITLDDRKFYGRGTKYDEDLAVTVSLIESLERIVVRHNKLSTTNGVAAHLIKSQAERKSLYELIERDLFLSHFLTNTPFTSLPIPGEIPSKVKDFINEASDTLLFFKMRKANLGTGYVCLITGGNKWGGILGLSFGAENQEDLILSAFLEAFRQYSYLRSLNQLQQNLSLDEFCNLKNWTFKSHALLLRNLDYFKSISDLFIQTDESNHHAVVYDESEFKFTELKSEVLPFNTLPLHVIQCSNVNCQNLYVGLMKKESISKAGVNRFLGFEASELNLLPHPLS